MTRKLAVHYSTVLCVRSCTLQYCTVCTVSAKIFEKLQPTLNAEKFTFLITLPPTDVINFARAFWWNSASDVDCLLRFVWPLKSSLCIVFHSSVSLFPSLATVGRRWKCKYYDMQRKHEHCRTKQRRLAVKMTTARFTKC